MNSFFKKHPDLVLISFTVMFLAVLIGYFFWGITALIGTFDKAISSPILGDTSSGYNLKDAAQLNLKGLVSPQ